MSGNKKLAALILAGSVAFVGLAGCGKAADKVAEKAVEKQTGGDVKINSDDGSVKYTDKDGNQTELNTGGGASLPDGWPDDLKPPKSVKIITANTSTIDGKKTMTVLGEAEGSIDDFLPAVKEQITGAGFDITQESSTDVTGGGYAGFTASDGKSDLVVSIAKDGTDDSKVSITMTISPTAS